MAEDSWPRLRAADNGDCAKIRDLVYSVLEEYGLKPDPDGTDEDLKDIEGSYSARGGAFYVLELEDATIVGAYGLYAMGTETCELRKMYLQRDWRGRGLGRLLLESALSKAKEMGFEKMVLETASVLTEAIGLYKRYGFAKYEPGHLSSRCDEAYVLELR